MVQVGCTSNYGRKVLWKKRKKFGWQFFLFCLDCAAQWRSTVAVAATYFRYSKIAVSALTISPQSARMIEAVRTDSP